MSDHEETYQRINTHTVHTRLPKLVQILDNMKRKLAALEKVDADLVSLRHKIRRDPPSYRQDFDGQFLIYSSRLEVFLSSPSTVSNEDAKLFHDLIDMWVELTHLSRHGHGHGRTGRGSEACSLANHTFPLRLGFPTSPIATPT